MKIRYRAVAGLAGAIGIAAASPALGDAVYAKGDWALLADGDLFVIDLDNGPTTLVTGTVNAATDVTVANCRAVVTTTDGSGASGVEVIDLPFALPAVLPDVVADDAIADLCPNDVVIVDPDECRASFDPTSNVLIIPCVDTFGGRYTARMARRGNSNNWEVTFLEEVTE
jgi:hypothetical protein